MIPRIIHQIWFQGHENLSEKYKIFQKTWKNQDTFEYKFWDSESISLLLQNHPEWLELYESYPSMIQKIDFAKYVILCFFGGVYIDMDVFAIKNLKDFMDTRVYNRDFIVCEHNTPCMTLTMNKLMGLDGTKIINNAVIFSSRDNIRIKAIITGCQQAQKNWRKNFTLSQLRVLITTGPITFTNSLLQFPDWKDCLIKPYVFEPFSTLEMVKLQDVFKECDENYTQYMQDLQSVRNMPETFGIHILDLSWFKNGKKNWKFRTFRSFQKMTPSGRVVIRKNANHQQIIQNQAIQPAVVTQIT